MNLVSLACLFPAVEQPFPTPSAVLKQDLTEMGFYNGV